MGALGSCLGARLLGEWAGPAGGVQVAGKKGRLGGDGGMKIKNPGTTPTATVVGQPQKGAAKESKWGGERARGEGALWESAVLETTRKGGGPWMPAYATKGTAAAGRGAALC